MPVGYYSASDVLTDEMISEVFAALGSSQKVTFGPSGTLLNKSEKLLPEKLVHKVRNYLDKKNILTRRIIWFDRPKSRMGDRSTAEVLVGRGWPRAIVSIVMGYDPVTLTRWGIETSDKETPPVILSEEVAEALGKSRLAAVNPGLLEKTSPNRMRLIGQCLTELLELIEKADNERKVRKEK
jgi:hypothetical protein